MELKYYLRGLGLGIVVTALIMGLTTSKNRTMTDAEIISRAKQLGMTEERTLKDAVSDGESDADGEDADNGDSADGMTTQDDSQADDVQAGEHVSVDGAPDPESSAADEAPAGTEEDSLTDHVPQENNVDEAAAQPMPQENEEEGRGMTRTETEQTPDDAETGNDIVEAGAASNDEPMVITIGSGDGSYSVSRKLADVGAVSSAENFDTFLCQNGYDKRIRTGTYTIPKGASNEQMARIITGGE